jgi:signal transduction histidine kinase
MARRFPPYTIRLRLTAIYGALFLVSGAGLLAVTYLLVRRSTPAVYAYQNKKGINLSYVTGPSAPHHQAVSGVRVTARDGREVMSTLTPQQAQVLDHRMRDLAVDQRAHELHQLLFQSGIALALMTAVSVLLGWLVAGRVLRPLRTVTETAQRISATNLHERLALSGPGDELKRLGDTIDALLARLEGAFESQRRFVANASHELRTPLTVIRALLQMALTDPDATVESFRATCQEAMAESEHQEHLIEALLVLARSERGLSRREPVDLAGLADEVLRARKPEADRRGLRIEAGLGAASVMGDPRLVERLLANLIDNALRHNIPGGEIAITTSNRSVTITNTGPVIAEDQVPRLLQPFQRLGPDSTDHSEGLGLGLSIVQAIADAHDAALTADARPGGGLAVRVTF